MRATAAEGEAKLEYFSGDFHVLRPGAYVVCAVTGQQIPMDRLRYWNHELQEAYVNNEVATRRHLEWQAGRTGASS